MASGDETQTTTASFSPLAAVFVVCAAVFLYYYSDSVSSSFSVFSSLFSGPSSTLSDLSSPLSDLSSLFFVFLSSSFSILSFSFSVLTFSFSVLSGSFYILSSTFSALSSTFSGHSPLSSRSAMPLIQGARLAAAGDCFLYFAFGSNLLTERIHINNPSARMLAVGKLKDYRLGFSHFSQRWRGAVATIVEAPGDHVYGVLWEINNEDMANLDRQEGVSQGVYRVLEVDVEIGGEEQVSARSYQLTQPQTDDPRPSAVYMDVIIRGARENCLPEDYIKSLENIEHNKYSGEVDVNLDLNNQRRQQQQQQPTQPAQ